MSLIPPWLAGYVLGLLSVLIMAPRYLTPIIVLMCVTVWYFVGTRPLAGPGSRHAQKPPSSVGTARQRNAIAACATI